VSDRLGDDRFVAKVCAGAAIFLGDRNAEQTGTRRRIPGAAVDLLVRAPLIDPVRRRILVKEALDRTRELDTFL